MAARKKAAKKRAPRKKVAKKAAKKAAKKRARRSRRPRREHEGLPPASDRELEQLRGAPQDLPPGRKGKAVTLELLPHQAPDLDVAYEHYRHSFPKASKADLVAWLLREYRRAEDLLP